jgi:hypothetical protein
VSESLKGVELCLKIVNIGLRLLRLELILRGINTTAVVHVVNSWGARIVESVASVHSELGFFIIILVGWRFLNRRHPALVERREALVLILIDYRSPDHWHSILRRWHICRGRHHRLNIDKRGLQRLVNRHTTTVVHGRRRHLLINFKTNIWIVRRWNQVIDNDIVGLPFSERVLKAFPVTVVAQSRNWFSWGLVIDISFSGNLYESLDLFSLFRNPNIDICSNLWE